MARISQARLVILAILFIFVSCAYSIQNTAPSPQNISETLYIKGKIAIKSKQDNFLGAVEIYSSQEKFLLKVKDPFFRLVLSLSFDKQKIIITKNGKTKQLPNNKKTKQKTLGLDLSSAELHAILWGKKTAKTKNLIFSLTGEQKFVLKKSKNNTITIKYLAWKKNKTESSSALPIHLKISSKKPPLEIVLAVQKHQIQYR